MIETPPPETLYTDDFYRYGKQGSEVAYINLNKLLEEISTKTATVISETQDENLQPAVCVNKRNSCSIAWFEEDQLPDIDSYQIATGDRMIISHLTESLFPVAVLLKAKGILLNGKNRMYLHGNPDVYIRKLKDRTLQLFIP